MPHTPEIAVPNSRARSISNHAPKIGRGNGIALLKRGALPLGENQFRYNFGTIEREILGLFRP
jgi:hypothetical protein